MNDKKCSSCKYFKQHFALSEGRLHAVFCGHCMHKNAKTKKPHAKACEYFEQGSELVEQLVTKQYLTKALLTKLLNMELAPDMTMDK